MKMGRIKGKLQYVALTESGIIQRFGRLCVFLLPVCYGCLVVLL